MLVADAFEFTALGYQMSVLLLHFALLVHHFGNLLGHHFGHFFSHVVLQFVEVIKFLVHLIKQTALNQSTQAE